MAEKSEINSLESLSKQKLLREIENIRRDTEIKNKELGRKVFLRASVIIGLISLVGVLATQVFLLKGQKKQFKKENDDREKNFNQQIKLQKEQFFNQTEFQKAQFELSQQLETKKHKGEMLMKAFDGKDTTETKKRILFLIDNHLIDDPGDSLRKAANKPTLLPSNTPSFNVNSPMPTVTITNASVNPCAKGEIDGCWQTSERGGPGDVIAVQVLFQNTSNISSKDTKIIIRPSRTKIFNQLVFTGSVSSKTFKKTSGEVMLKIVHPQELAVAFMLNDAEWFSSANQKQGYPVSEDDLLDVEKNGFNVGTIPPGGQGVLIARFVIANR